MQYLDELAQQASGHSKLPVIIINRQGAWHRGGVLVPLLAPSSGATVRFELMSFHRLQSRCRHRLRLHDLGSLDPKGRRVGEVEGVCVETARVVIVGRAGSMGGGLAF